MAVNPFFKPIFCNYLVYVQCSPGAGVTGNSTRSGPALDDSRDEYCIIKYVENLEKNIKEEFLEIFSFFYKIQIFFISTFFLFPDDITFVLNPTPTLTDNDQRLFFSRKSNG
jgi:hypothetical protein